MIIQNKKKLKTIIEEAKAQNKSVLIKKGCFDIIHPGHVLCIQRFAKLADVVIILVMSDRAVRARKGKERPINPQKERALVMDGIKGVDYVYPDKTNTNEEYIELLDYLKPTMLNILCNTQKKNEFCRPYWKLTVCEDNKEYGTSTTTMINSILKKYKTEK